jgi:hypothetical protein
VLGGHAILAVAASLPQATLVDCTANWRQAVTTTSCAPLTPACRIRPRVVRCYMRFSGVSRPRSSPRRLGRPLRPVLMSTPDAAQRLPCPSLPDILPFRSRYVSESASRNVDDVRGVTAVSRDWRRDWASTGALRRHAPQAGPDLATGRPHRLGRLQRRSAAAAYAARLAATGRRLHQFSIAGPAGRATDSTARSRAFPWIAV